MGKTGTAFRREKYIEECTDRGNDMQLFIPADSAGRRYACRKIAGCVVDQLKPYITTAITDVTARGATSTMNQAENVEEPSGADEIDEIDPGALEFLAGL